jgi:Zn-dependent peptidase ImmA (M78 family)
VEEKQVGDTLEREAVDFARETLMPQEPYRAFVAAGSLFVDDVIRLSREFGITSGIIVWML